MYLIKTLKLNVINYVTYPLICNTYICKLIKINPNFNDLLYLDNILSLEKYILYYIYDKNKCDKWNHKDNDKYLIFKK